MLKGTSSDRKVCVAPTSCDIPALAFAGRMTMCRFASLKEKFRRRSLTFGELYTCHHREGERSTGEKLHTSTMDKTNERFKVLSGPRSELTLLRRLVLVSCCSFCERTKELHMPYLRPVAFTYVCCLSARFSLFLTVLFSFFCDSSPPQLPANWSETCFSTANEPNPYLSLTRNLP